MLIETAIRLLSKHADGPVEPVGGNPNQVRAVVNGRRVDVTQWLGKVCRVVVETLRLTASGDAGCVTHYSGRSLRDGLRAALHQHRDEDVEAGGATVRLAAEVTHGSVSLTPDLHFQVNGVVVSILQDGEAFSMAEQFFQTGEGRPLLDWLQERSPEVAAEVERVRRLAAR
jgi:hypothetical protein